MTEQDTYTDLGATTREAVGIAETSMDIIRTFVPDETLNDRPRQKAIHSTGGIEFQYLVRCQNSPVVAGAKAVPGERPVVTEITMAKTGITGRDRDCQMRKAIGNRVELAAETGMTRTAAAMLELDKEGVCDGVIAVVGNAPTAALALCDCIENGTRPVIVITTPVGSMKAEESRERVHDVVDEYSVPAATNVRKHDRSGFTAAPTNELIHVASDVCNGGVDLANHE